MSTIRNNVLILAGGLGTRLQTVVSDRPKVLVPVLGRTFLDFLVFQLHEQGLRHIVFLLGYRHKMVEAHIQTVLATRFPDMDFAVSVENSPLGTAGALRMARAFCNDTFLVINGDTYVEFDAKSLIRTHHKTSALITMLALKVDDAGRYGSLDMDSDGRIHAFREKEAVQTPGLINAGIYAMEPGILESIPDNSVLSLEHTLLPMLLKQGEHLQALQTNGHFFDIGTPESYAEFVNFVQQSQMA